IVSPEVDHAVHLSEHLAENGVEVHVVAQKGSGASKHTGITVYPVMERWNWLELPRFTRVLKRCAPDVVLLMYLYWNFDRQAMITFLPTICKTLLPRAGFVTLFEEADGVAPWEWNTRWVRAVRRLMRQWAGGAGVDDAYGTLLRDSDRVVVVSDRIGAKLNDRQLGLKTKSDVVPVPPILYMSPEDEDGAIRRAVRERLGMQPAEHLLVYFGYIYPGKGIETLLHGFAQVVHQGGDLRLLLVGGSFDTLERPG